MNRSIRWTRRALRRLDEIGGYVASHDPTAAHRIVTAIAGRVLDLRQYPMSGRIGRVENTRELVVSGTDYLVAYRIDGRTIEVLTALHAAQAWPDSL